MKSEALVSNEVERAAAYAGLLLYRNNSGACEDKTGRQIRYGLGNISAPWNKLYKSPDWVGGTPLFIEPKHVGTVKLVLTGIETKRENWRFSLNDEHDVAQERFMRILRDAGGYAGFAQSTDDLMRIIGRGK